MPSASRRALCRKLWAIIGLNTFSSKLPDAPPTVIATSLPNTWQHSMVSASHWVGLTLPGMIELPGSFSGMRDFAQARARAGRHPAHVVGDFHQRGGQRLERAVRRHQRIVAGQRGELVGRGLEAEAGARGQFGGDPGGEFRMRVQAGADRGAAGRQQQQAGQGVLDQLLGNIPAAPRSRKTPGPGSAAWRPAGGCGRS